MESQLLEINLIGEGMIHYTGGIFYVISATEAGSYGPVLWDLEIWMS